MNDKIKENIEKEQKNKILERILNQNDVKDSYINAEWEDVVNNTIIRIGYYSLRSVLFIDYKTGIEYIERITKDIFNSLLKSDDLESYITELKNSHFSEIYKIK